MPAMPPTGLGLPADRLVMWRAAWQAPRNLALAGCRRVTSSFALRQQNWPRSVKLPYSKIILTDTPTPGQPHL